MATRFRKLAALAVLAAGAIAPAASAELIYMTIRESSAMDPQDKLLTFDSATPGTVTDLGFITGLGNLQYLAGIDFRPATGELYGLGYTGSVYKIDINTLAATNQGFIAGSPTSWVNAGFDFNPTVDLIRVTDGPTAVNAVFNPVLGTGAPQTPLSYAVGDPNVGATPEVGGVAYSNNVNGAVTTTAYGIDVGPLASARLVTINPPAAGTLNTVGNLGVTAGEASGFDISGATGVAYVVLSDFVNGQNIPTLYTINLATGAATIVGAVGVDTFNYRVTGISVAPDFSNGGGGPNGVPLPLPVVAGPVIAGVAMWMRRRAVR
ncbi:MAG TPA: DUF4394 domain-containing protein [Tepidisphaeraceae bacterium]|nr:DUF4394 domain-containing protein [Tepidisphaeraceae bacterium]